MTNTNNRGATRNARPALRELSWSQFCELPGLTRAIRWNVYNAIDGDGRRLSKATLKFGRRHNIGHVYAPGTCPS